MSVSEPSTVPSPIRLLVRRLSNGADLPLPRQMTEHAAGFDVRAAVDAGLLVRRGEIRLIPCGFAMAVPVGYEAQVRPRSGLATKHGITMINAPGTIDADYRGEVKVPLINLGPSDFTITRGMRIAQMLILPVPAVQIVEVDELDATARGEKGFGHTGAT